MVTNKHEAENKLRISYTSSDFCQSENYLSNLPSLDAKTCQTHERNSFQQLEMSFSEFQSAHTSTGGCVTFWVWPPSQQQSISINLTLKTGVTFVEKKTISLQPWSPWFYHLGPPNRSVCPGVDAEVSPQAVQTTPPKNQTAINNLKIRPFGKGKNMHVRYFAIK